MDSWKILRILTTNKCNYRCLYCHNEGQSAEQLGKLLAYEDFIKVAEAIDGVGIREIRFSGGEPLLNAETINMIEWINTNTDYELGLATNGSMLTEEIALRLSSTRTMVTLHLPSVKDSEYNHITGMSNQQFWQAVHLLDQFNVEHSFNYVLYPDTIANLPAVIKYVVESGKRVKLLPFIEQGFNNYSQSIVEQIERTMGKEAISQNTNKDSGIITWIFKGGGKVKLLESPCYDHNITRCRTYGELRLLPDLSLQKCIFDKSPVSISDMSILEIRTVIEKMWNSFTKCI